MCVFGLVLPEDLDDGGSPVAQCGVMLCPRRILLAEIGVGV